MATPEIVRPKDVDLPQVFCLGPLQIWRDERMLQKAVRIRARELLAYLIAYPEGASKDRIVETIWSDLEPSQADREFNRAASLIRRYARGRGDSRHYLEKRLDVWSLNRDEWWIDAWESDRLVAEAARSPRTEDVVAKLQSAVALYRSEFCSDSYFSTIEPVRERYRATFVRASVRLAEHRSDAGESEDALAILDRALLEDPYCEDVARMAMTIEGTLGRRATAVERYRRFSKRLREELDVDPDPRTQALNKQLTRGSAAVISETA